ncbi:Uncharacterized protein SCF082_LOCUS44176 [Durusdinium trenchii]|uniref:MYND-type domain-containing protein n=1 Tax=Durusdinium trenchii TaxID=1381693 RepID=A0ABP0R2U4_9DINO
MASQQCAHCGQSDYLKRCSLCREVFYCGRDCQKRDLRRHRQQDGCISNHCAGKRSPPTELREISCKWKGDTFKVKVEFEATVADLKKHIFAKHKELPVDQQMLFYSENVLDGQTPIKDLDIKEGAPSGDGATKSSEDVDAVKGASKSSAMTAMAPSKAEPGAAGHSKRERKNRAARENQRLRQDLTRKEDEAAQFARRNDDLQSQLTQREKENEQLREQLDKQKCVTKRLEKKNIAVKDLLNHVQLQAHEAHDELRLKGQRITRLENENAYMKKRIEDLLHQRNMIEGLLHQRKVVQNGNSSEGEWCEWQFEEDGGH